MSAHHAAAAESTPPDEGGGGEPEWVRSGAYIDIDFIGGDPQGRAYLAGTGEVDPVTLLGEDVNAGSWEPTYDAESITADGYYSNDSLGFIGALGAKIVAGSTVRIVLKQVVANGDTPGIIVLSANESAYVEIDISQSSMDVISFSGTGAYSNQIDNVLDFDNPSEGAINILAITLTPTRAEIACNNSAPIADVLTTAEFPTSGENQIVAAIWSGNELIAIQRITVYDALPSTAGLQALSQP